VLMILYYKVLDTKAFDDVMNMAIENAGDDDQQIRGVEMMRPYMVFFIGFGAAVVYTFFGLIVSLVGASVIKKVRPFEEEGNSGY